MSSLDDDLKQALTESEANAPQEPPGVAVAPESATARRPGPRLGLLIGLILASAGILYFVLGRSADEFVYSKQVEEVLASWSALSHRKLRVQGVLVPGSLMRREEPCEYRFQMRPQGTAPGGATSAVGEVVPKLDVHYPSCIVADTFRDVPGMDVQVTAEGRLEGDHFHAEHIFAKCPSKYEMKQRQVAGEAAPHAIGSPAEILPMTNPMDALPRQPALGQGS